MTELEKFQLINSCETIDELTEAIYKIADDSGNIMGRTRLFNAVTQASNARELLKNKNLPLNYLTRSYGIRQQVAYLRHYYE